MNNDLDHLGVLDLTNNRITSASVKALAEKKVQQIQQLILSQNFLDEGAIRAIRAISFNLYKLDLSGCNLIGPSLSLLKDT